MTRVAKDVIPSVVTVSVTSASGMSSGTGSGEFVRTGGFVVTNNHVIAGATNGGSVSLTLDDGGERTAQIIGRDSLTDLAVLRANGSEGSRPIALGSSDTLSVGRSVVAVARRSVCRAR